MINKPISDIMRTNVITANPGETLSEVINKMSETDIHELPIVDRENRLVGYFSFDILSKKKHISLYAKIDKLMVSPPKVNENKSILEGAELILETGFRALPVVDKKDRIKGIISSTDIIREVPRLGGFNSVKAEDMMTPDPEVLYEKETLERAVDVMLGLGELSAPVVDEAGSLSGSVMIDEISRSLWNNNESVDIGDLIGENNKPRIEIKSFVTEVAIVKSDASIEEVSKEMIRLNPYLCVVVDDSKKAVGVITQSDILEHLVAHRSEREFLVSITGLEIKDPFAYSSMVSKLERFVKKLGKYNWIVAYSLDVHVQKHDKGGKKKWSVRARLVTDKNSMHVKNHDYNLLKCVDQAIDEMNRKILAKKKKTRISNKE